VCGNIRNGYPVRIDAVTETDGKQLRAHVCEAPDPPPLPKKQEAGGEGGGGGGDPVPAAVSGWVSINFLRCLWGQCGHCHTCEEGILPSDARAIRLAREAKEAEEDARREAEGEVSIPPCTM